MSSVKPRRNKLKTPAQIDALKQAYEENAYLVPKTLETLIATGMTKQEVYVAVLTIYCMCYFRLLLGL